MNPKKTIGQREILKIESNGKGKVVKPFTM